MVARRTIQKYYDCFKESDKEGLRSILTEDFQHVSGNAIYNGRDAMIEEMWSGVGTHWAEDLQIFGSHPSFMVHYNVASDDGAVCRMAELIHFTRDKISSIEVFKGRNFEEAES